MTSHWRVLEGDCREVLATLPERSVHTVVTSPPYFGLRDYGSNGQIGLEPTPDEFVQALVGVFREVHRVLRDDSTVWLNLGDSYSGSAKGNPGAKEADRGGDRSHEGVGAYAKTNLPGIKHKDLIGIPWAVAFALRADGWYLRSDIIWSKPNPMPESVTDRPTKAHETIFLLSKQPRYHFDADAIREEPSVGTVERFGDRASARINAGTRVPGRMDYEPDRAGEHNMGVPDGGRNKRSVWTVATQPYAGAHFATFPPKLIEPCVLAGCPEGGTVLDPFAGAGTTGLVALQHGRGFVGVELNPEYAAMARTRIGTAVRLGFRPPQQGPEAHEDQVSLFNDLSAVPPAGGVAHERAGVAASPAIPGTPATQQERKS